MQAVCVLLLTPFPVSGQAGRHTVYTIKDGIPDNGISCLLQDSKGFIWAGSNSGLIKYDGYYFKSYKHNPRDTNSIASNSVSCLYQDETGLIWVGLHNMGLSCYNPVTNVFTNYRHHESDTNSIGQNTVYEVFSDSKRRLWFGLGGKGVDMFDRKAKKFIHYKFKGGSNTSSELYANIINDIDEDSKGNIWFSSQYGLHCLESATNRLKTFYVRKDNYLPVNHNLFMDLFIENDTSFWMATWASGIYHYNPEAGTYKQYLCRAPDYLGGTKNIITRILPKSGNEFWVTSYDSGFSTFNKQTGKFRKNDEVLDGRFFIGVTAIKDHTGNVWIGTERNGLIKYETGYSVLKTFKVPPLSRYPANMSIAHITRDKHNARFYLYPLYGNGIIITDTLFTQFECIPYPGNRDKIFSVYRVLHDSKNRIWMRTDDGLLRYDIALEKYITVSMAATDKTWLKHANDIKEDNKGNIWFCNKNGFFKYNEKELVHYLPACSDRGIFNDMHTMFIDREDNIWICNSFYGLAKFNETKNQLDNYLPVAGDKNSITQSSLMNITQDIAGNYWIATSGSGICRMKLGQNGKPVFYGFAFNDKIGEMLTDVQADKKGNVWISDRKGIHIYSAETNTLVTIDENKGLSDNYRGENIFIDIDGSLKFGAMADIQTMRLQDYHYNTSPPPVVLSSFKVNGEEIKTDTSINYLSAISLEYNQNFISFEMAALNYEKSELNNYAYRLSGLESDWNYAGSRRYGGYTDLKPGKYTLQIKASNNDNVWNENGMSLAIVIAPPFWHTWWFYALTSVLFMLIVYAVYRYRLNIIREREKIKTEFNKKVAEIEMTALRAQMNPHFLFNCLNSINKYVLMNDSDTASEYLTRFAKLIRLILDNSKQDTITLADELEALGLYMEMESLRFENLFEYTIEVDEDTDVSSVYIPPLLLQPFVENAVWHGLMHKESSGFIHISVSVNQGMLLVIIEDNGVGRKKAKEYASGQTLKRKSHGLQITNDRISILNKMNNSNAEVEVLDMADEQGNGTGTKVIIRLPLLRKPGKQPAENKTNEL